MPLMPRVRLLAGKDEAAAWSTGLTARVPAVGAAAARQCPRRAAEQNLVAEAAAATRVAVACVWRGA